MSDGFLSGRTGWLPRNAHPRNNQQGLPVCPFHELLDEIGRLLGIDPAAETEFCGVVGTGVNDIGFLSGRRGTEYESVMFCYHLADKLEEVLTGIEQFGNFDFEACFLRMAEYYRDSDLEMLSSEVERLSSATKAKRDLVLLTENAPLIGDPARSRTEQEIVEYARVLLRNLIEQVTGHARRRATLIASMHWGGGSHAPLCPIFPRGGFDGMMS